MVDHLLQKFPQIPMSQNLVPFKGRHCMKQYLPLKPKKWEFKYFVLADSGDIVHDFISYTGKILSVEKERIPDLGPSSNIVLHLAEAIPNNNNYLLYCDNWFTSVPLLIHLAEWGILCCGTVGPNRIPRLDFAAGDKVKKDRGSFEEWRSCGKHATLSAVRRHDSKDVTLISTFTGSQPKDTVVGYDKANKRCRYGNHASKHCEIIQQKHGWC